MMAALVLLGVGVLALPSVAKTDEVDQRIAEVRARQQLDRQKRGNPPLTPAQVKFQTAAQNELLRRLTVLEKARLARLEVAALAKEIDKMIADYEARETRTQRYVDYALKLRDRGDLAGARSRLEDVVKNYGDTTAAREARKILEEMSDALPH